MKAIAIGVFFGKPLKKNLIVRFSILKHDDWANIAAIGIKFDAHLEIRVKNINFLSNSIKDVHNSKSTRLKFASNIDLGLQKNWVNSGDDKQWFVKNTTEYRRFLIGYFVGITLTRLHKNSKQT